LRDREDQPLQRRRRRGENDGKSKSPDRGFFDPRPKAREAEILGYA